MNKSPKRELVKLLQANARNSSTWDTFRDFLELSALSLANTVDLRQAPAREERYLSIIKRYQPEEAKRFSHMLAMLVEELEADRGDVMGSILGEMELGNAARGQFFTPYHLCQAMARMMINGDELRAEIDRKGYITLNEPTVGGGAMVIAFAEAMQDAGFNYQQQLHVTAQDVDPRAVHMAFVQFTLVGIPAVVIHGNTLALEEREHWLTPAHMLGFWEQKLRRGYALGSAMDRDRDQVLSPAAPEIVMPPQGDLFALLEQAA